MIIKMNPFFEATKLKPSYIVLVTQELLLDLGFIKIVTLVLPYSHSLRGKPTSQGFHKTKAELISLLFDWNKNVYFRGCKMKKNKQSF